MDTPKIEGCYRKFQDGPAQYLGTEDMNLLLDEQKVLCHAVEMFMDQ
eukprot:CAMPEP_0113301272 /NCGR_PEP_ID=MMETSP0010_2-20120614/2571_1 /TAXON_ID=216773 ORGANISM="Corethron hystrix, Strain 308" /NCGR_SAMPLE_ID=MMETSP0010_2 /ASSEMBLY_ACC=CAM_ASM_000155 /LENGTH=46 /DNA_ID=CAMNT_0000154869 /DNA_START=57 /DNA_END=197 /DNA_ORIENTATION=+ /assembly_acc=CAM_ASM_000155